MDFSHPVQRLQEARSLVEERVGAGGDSLDIVWIRVRLPYRLRRAVELLVVFAHFAQALVCDPLRLVARYMSSLPKRLTGFVLDATGNEVIVRAIDLLPYCMVLLDFFPRNKSLQVPTSGL